MRPRRLRDANGRRGAPRDPRHEAGDELARPPGQRHADHARRRLWLYVIAALVLAFLAVPTLIVVPMSFSNSQYLEFPPREWSLRWYRNYFESRSWMQATATSFKAGRAHRAGGDAARARSRPTVYRASRFRLARAVHVLLITPMIVPVILVGIARVLRLRARRSSTTRSWASCSRTACSPCRWC